MDSENPTIRKILFATDLSENANKAFRHAASLAGVYGAEITILHVIETMPPNAELLLAATLGYKDVQELKEKSQDELIHRIRGWIEGFCAQAADRLPACPFAMDKIIVEPGKAANRILHHADTGGYDLLVMGSRGHGAFREAVLGGVTHKVVSDCRIPVFLSPLSGAKPVSPR
ncbi:MAG: universal stress protein [Desulfatibacillum sp.]|nr:universal stress protein [Desulfatibacillum sp.]